MMAAATIVEEQPSAQVILIEKNPRLGRKVIISGGGRCNVTTGITNVRELLTNYPRGSKFLTSAMNQFSPDQVYGWFEGRGVPLKIEADNRVFPVSNDGHDIVGVFERLFQKSNCELRLEAAVERVEKKSIDFEIILKSGETLTVDKVIITTGGLARRYTGSTGDGYAFAEYLGHTVTPISPSLNSFLTAEAWPGQYAGISFERIQLTWQQNKKTTATGPIVFTHKGLSGPAVFRLSAQVAHEQYSKEHPLSITIDFVPDQSSDQVLQELNQLIERQPKRFAKFLLQPWLPKRLAEEVMTQLCIPADQHGATIGKASRRALVHWLKACPLHVIGRSPGDEFVTAGGVDLTEVNPSTMESRVCSGLYFAGEVLDIDGYTGGFNLQASWATGRLAGQSASL